MDVKRFLPLGGVAAVAVVVLAVAVLGGNTPGNDASGAEVASYYDAHQAREFAAAFLLAASAPLLVIFSASLTAALWPSEAVRRPVWELVLLAGSALAAGAFVVAAFLTFALADGAVIEPVGLVESFVNVRTLALLVLPAVSVDVTDSVGLLASPMPQAKLLVVVYGPPAGALTVWAVCVQVPTVPPSAGKIEEAGPEPPSLTAF